MQRSPLGLRIPEGMRDLLPEEIRLQEQLEGKILNLFRRWSYQKVVTPTLEYVACVQPEWEQDDELYKFFDRKGQILALRPEFTTPIARLVGTRLRNAQFPLRLCYGEDAFRNFTARYREFRQVGVELIGSESELADAEVIALAVEALRVLGIEHFQLNLGHMGVFSGLMTQAGVEGELRARLEEALVRKDFVAIEHLIGQSGLPAKAKSLLLNLPHLHGGEEMLDQVSALAESPEIRESVDSLRRIYGCLEAFGVQEAVALDLGVLRGFTYYTGVVFEGYVSSIGYPVVEGGRYDALYADFGFPQPATGFAVNLGSLLEMFSPEMERNADALVCGTDSRQVIERCQGLRSEGLAVEMILEPLSRAEAETLAAGKGIERLEYLEEKTEDE